MHTRHSSRTNLKRSTFGGRRDHSQSHELLATSQKGMSLFRRNNISTVQVARYVVVGVICAALAVAGVDRAVMIGLAGGALVATVITVLRIRALK